MPGPEEAALAAGMKAAGPIVSAAISQAVDSIRSISSSITDRIVRELRLGYSDFLIASYNRCQQVKTVVTGDQPVPLMDVYVQLRLLCNDISISDVDLVNDLEKYKRLVISGTGGAGKSMLMKFLTIARFENTKGRIPLFVELRNLNNLTTKDLLQFCFQSCSTSMQRVTFQNFEKVFSAGGFVLILDGFDEIDSEYRDEVERQILKIGRDYPDSIVIVSSRNDSRFKGWQDYHVFEVAKLSKQQVKDLINKVKYEAGIKRRFIKDLDNLWATHESFLSIPLLAVIMLLTFGKFSEISPKATLFYKLAFQTLFREHDANKEQFKRPMHTSLDLDDFERSFAAFCALSYLENKYSFSMSLAKGFTSGAKRYARIELKEDDYIKDLVQNVCMLQQEGTDLAFVHRSFQEYFTALFLTGYHERNQFQIINEVASRENDSTLAMFKELDEAKFEINWLVPTLESLMDSLDEAMKGGSPSKALNWLFKGGLYNDKLEVTGLLVAERGKSSIIRHIGKLYPDSEEKLSVSQIFKALRPDSLTEIFDKSGASKRRPIAAFIKKSNAGPNIGSIELKYTAKDDDWLKMLPIINVLKRMREALGQLHERISSQRSDQEAIVNI